MRIISGRLDRGYELFKQEFVDKAIEVLDSGYYVLGTEVAAFEKEFADHNGVRFCVGLANGLDALTLAVRALGIGEGDEVIVPANTYIASIMGVTINRATPVL